MTKTTKSNKQAEPKQARTIKVKTVVISVAVLLGLVASFIGGVYTANGYHDTVNAQAVSLAKKLDSK